MAWRALAVVLLICFVLQESEILRIDLATRMRIDLATGGSSFLGGVGASGYDVREKLIPICAILHPALPPMFAELLDGIDLAGVWFWGMFPAQLAAGVQAWLDPGRLFWILSMVGLALFLSELALRPPALRIAPFDLVGRSPGRLVRFTWLTLGLTVVCLAALPTLIVLGQVILHVRLGISTWPASGWPLLFVEMAQSQLKEPPFTLSSQSKVANLGGGDDSAAL